MKLNEIASAGNHIMLNGGWYLERDKESDISNRDMVSRNWRIHRLMEDKIYGSAEIMFYRVDGNHWSFQIWSPQLSLIDMRSEKKLPDEWFSDVEEKFLKYVESYLIKNGLPEPTEELTEASSETKIPRTINLGKGFFLERVAMLHPRLNVNDTQRVSTFIVFAIKRFMFDEQIGTVKVKLEDWKPPSQHNGYWEFKLSHVEGQKAKAVKDAADWKQLASEIMIFMEKKGVLELLDESRKVKPSYLKGLNPEEKKEMKQEIKRFSKMDHRDKAAYPADWTADRKYKERLKKKGKELPRSRHTKKFERMYGK